MQDDASRAAADGTRLRMAEEYDRRHRGRLRRAVAGVALAALACVVVALA